MKVNKQKLQIAMANACMNVEDLALKAEISRISLGNYCSGKSEPRMKTLGKIARALNVRVEELIDMDGD